MIESEGVGGLGLGLGLVETELCMWFYVKLRKAKKIMALEMMGGKGNGMKGKKKTRGGSEQCDKSRPLSIYLYLFEIQALPPPTPRLLRREDQGSKKKKRKNCPPLEFV